MRSADLWRALLHRSRSDWPVVLAAAMLLVCATALIAASAVYGDVVAIGGLRQTLLAAPPADRAVIVRSASAPGDVRAIDDAVSARANEVLGPSGGEVAFIARSGSFTRPGFAADDPAALTILAAYRGIERHGSLVDGRWPTPGHDPLEATVSEGAGAALQIAIGDRLSLAGREGAGATVAVEIVGLWKPNRNDTFWAGNAFELDGLETLGSFTTSGPIVVDAADLVGLTSVGELDLEWRAIPAADALTVEGLAAEGADLKSLDQRLRESGLGARSVHVASGLPDILARVERASLVSRSGITLLTIQFAVLAGYAIVLVARMLIERRRVESSLLRSRGASSLQLAAMAFGEALILAIPAAIVAPFLAVGVVQLLAAIGPLAAAGIAGTATIDGGVLLVAAAAAIACVVALTLPSIAPSGTPAGVRARLSRQVGRTLGQRLGIDLVFVVLAGLALWQLRLYGSPLTRTARGVLGIDPLLIAAPAVGLIAGGIVASRLIPRLAEIAERILPRRSGLVAAIGARQLARRPLRYTRSALLLMLAAALGTFAAADAATWSRSQADQAAYRVGADVRVVPSDYSTVAPWAAGAALRSIRGVRLAAPVARGPLDVGRAVRDGQLLAFDPDSVPAAISFPPEDSARGLPGTLKGLSADRPSGEPTIELAGAPRRLSVTINSDIHADPEVSPDGVVPPDWAGIEAAALVEDASGRIHRLAGGNGSFQASGERLVIPLTQEVGGESLAIAAPLRLRGIELTLRAPPDATVVGTIDLVAVDASSEDQGDDWTATGYATVQPGWEWALADERDNRTLQTVTPGRIEIGQTGVPPEALFASSSTTLRTWAPTMEPEEIPALVSDAFLQLSGSGVGDVVAASTAGQPISLRIIGSAPSFPTLDPAKGFAVVDATTLERARLATVGQLLPTAEWWLGVEPGSAPVVAKAVSSGPLSDAEVIERTALTRALSTDPISLGIVGALGLGAIAALAFATIGFVVSASVTTGERLTEFAILRGLGMSARELVAWLALESAFLLGFGLLVGAAFGVGLAWLVLPFATLTETGAAAVPPPDIIVPWQAFVPVALAAVGLLAFTVLLVTRQVRRAAISTVLRSGAE